MRNLINVYVWTEILQILLQIFFNGCVHIEIKHNVQHGFVHIEIKHDFQHGCIHIEIKYNFQHFNNKAHFFIRCVFEIYILKNANFHYF